MKQFRRNDPEVKEAEVVLNHPITQPETEMPTKKAASTAMVSKWKMYQNPHALIGKNHIMRHTSKKYDQFALNTK